MRVGGGDERAKNCALGQAKLPTCAKIVELVLAQLELGPDGRLSEPVLSPGTRYRPQALELGDRRC